jgi:outer membrane murein-binding lipoprotein Lpp
MKKWLLIWNIVLTIVLLLVALGGCATSDSRVDWAITQIQALEGTVTQLQSTVQTQGIQIAMLESNLQSALNQIQAYLQTSGH